MLAALIAGVWLPLSGCDQLGLGKSSEKASKDKKDKDDEDEDKKKKKKKKKKDETEESEETDEGDAKDKPKTAKPKEDDTPPPEPPKTAEPAIAGESFAGKYRSTYGDVRVSQKGDKVTGTYPGGTLDCTAEGKKLDCNWKDGFGVGKSKLEKQANGDLKGTWGKGASATDGGPWLFTLLEAGEPGKTGEEAAAGDFAGTYVSTWGDTVFTEEANKKVKGTYPGGKLDCVSDGAKLDCDWKDSAGTGKAALTRQTNGNISGTWGFGANTTNGGSWLFRKKS